MKFGKGELEMNKKLILCLAITSCLVANSSFLYASQGEQDKSVEVISVSRMPIDPDAEDAPRMPIDPDAEDAPRMPIDPDAEDAPRLA